MELLPETLACALHDLKFEVLDKTFALLATPWSILGGPKLLAPLAAAL